MTMFRTLTAFSGVLALSGCVVMPPSGDLPATQMPGSGITYLQPLAQPQAPVTAPGPASVAENAYGLVLKPPASEASSFGAQPPAGAVWQPLDLARRRAADLTPPTADEQARARDYGDGILVFPVDGSDMPALRELYDDPGAVSARVEPPPAPIVLPRKNNKRKPSRPVTVDGLSPYEK